MFILAALFALASEPDTTLATVYHQEKFPSEQACKETGEKDIPMLRQHMAKLAGIPEADIAVKIVCKLDGKEA